MAIYHRFLNRDTNNKMLTFIPVISIIVPAYNEQEGIHRTLDSLIECDYPSKEVIVVDDGSSDLTYAIASKYAANTKNCKITVLRKPNGGKSSAINYGLRFAGGDIIVIVDADSAIERNALKEIAKEFQHPEVVAVAGTVNVLNPTNILTRLIAFETVTGQNLLRPAYSLLGSIMIIPGALGGFSKKRLFECGLYDKDTLTEDFDITVKVAKRGGRIVATVPTSYTQVPTTLKGLYKQRLRWYRGILQTFLKHKDAMTIGSYGRVHQIGYPISLFLFLFPPFLDVLLIIFAALTIIEGFSIPFILPFTLYFGFQFLLSTIAIIMDYRDERKLISCIPLYIFGYRQLIDFFIIKSIFDIVLQKKNFTW
jgi:cellulose synthase/poly-beta-1,6-N-acetylglucosamine synthase-like glycosyltransferase